MKRHSKINTLIWVLIPVLIVLTLISLFIKLRQYHQPQVIPEIDNREIAKPEEKLEETAPDHAGHKARIAIVIDDIGHDEKVFRKFVDLGIPLTFSILPGERFSTNIANEARHLDYEIILHLPMEPHSSLKNPGNGALSLKMSRDEMLQQLSRDIEAIPYIVGVNNHMGSLLTENRVAMNILLEEIHRKGLFFLDSKTSPDSVAYEIAKSIGLKSGQRDVFLDNSPDIEYIKGQIDKVIKIAKRNGEATAIGHPRPETVAALREKMPEFEKEGIELVPVSEVLD